MADTDEVKEQKDSKENTDDKKTSKGGILLWIIPAVVVAFCAGAGLGCWYRRDDRGYRIERDGRPRGSALVPEPARRRSMETSERSQPSTSISPMVNTSPRPNVRSCMPASCLQSPTGYAIPSPRSIGDSAGRADVRCRPVRRRWGWRRWRCAW